MAPPEKKHKRPVGAGLALDKFATLGVSKFDKRKKLERIQKQKLIKHSKYRKLKQKLEAQGILSGVPVKDSVAELEALDADAPLGSGDGSEGADDGVEHEERIKSHARTGPSSKPQPPAQEGPPRRMQAVAPAAAIPNANRNQQGTAGSAAAFHEQRSGDRKRSREDSDDAGPGEGPGRRQAPVRKGGEQYEGRRDQGDAGQGPGGRSSGKQRAGEGTSGGRVSSGGVGRESSRGGDKGDGSGGKMLSRLQRLAQKVAEEKAEKQKAKEQAMKEREERMKKVAAVEKARKEQKHLHFKRTATGQPLMRYRMEKLLSQIQKTVQ
ncbi:hypothetical protein PLESTB_000464800 [Pleodorina starrii]|uniref:rRNA-processing protein FYV7 n=1 Tax=Pleodorina starrii TaxID=330485 RepID=A0A9W6EZX4_9CHLO|nr:hypothetical protein PLESTM_000799300 [Pleodorina starrii]GLC51089.1 hypothetical protein PLESTB_000464800 [Pleodorina starrii]GLC63447.1 hypothetical protein PLESTF_000037300 [Pleodorina starrii]